MTEIRVGILGGGQLAKMIAQEAQRMGIGIWVLDPHPACPASFVADHTIVGSLEDESGIRELARHCSIVTYDIEHVNTTAIQKLEGEGYQFAPSGSLLALIQDKGTQKNFFASHGIPMPRFKLCDSYNDNELKEFGFPLVQKARKGGYDGKGVQILRGPEDKHLAFQHNFLIEELVSIEKELGIMVARNSSGEIQTYPLTEMVFDPQANICDMVMAPAQVSPDIENQAKEIAIHCVESLNGVGVFGIELFLTSDGKIFYNEIAPRPHNSGHYTIEACETSQFEQHIRGILNLPLGSSRLLSSAVMFNLLGQPGYSGKPVIQGWEEAFKIPGLAIHIYRKSITKPYRKMGHITITAPTLEEALNLAQKIKPKIRVISEEI